MLTNKLYRLPYRAIQKVVLLEGVRTLVATTEHLAQQPAMHGISKLSQERLSQFLSAGEAPHCEKLLERMDNHPKLHCYGAIRKESLVAFSWLHEGSAEAEMNYGYHVDTATAVALDPSAAFFFHAYTAPHQRGRGWMGALLGHAARDLHATAAIEWLVTTTEVANHSAWRGMTKIGFRPRGVYWRYGIAGRSWGHYPKASAPIVAFG